MGLGEAGDGWVFWRLAGGPPVPPGQGAKMAQSLQAWLCPGRVSDIMEAGGAPLFDKGGRRRPPKMGGEREREGEGRERPCAHQKWGYQASGIHPLQEPKF